MKKKNLIVGMLLDLSYYDIEPFIDSFKKNFKNDNVKLIAHTGEKISEWTRKQLTDHDVELIDFPEDMKNKYIGYARFYLLEKYLKEHHGEYAQVLMTDMRDVIIQGDPFETYKQYESYLVYATEYLKIKDQPDNSSWIIRNYGREAFENIKENTIVCAGTLMGTADAMETALHEVNKFLIKDSFNNHGADQASLNYFIYNKKLPIDTIIENDVATGVICTNGWIETPIKDDKILTLNGKIPAVVHQYDRNVKLINFVNTLYRPNDVIIDKEYEDDINSLLDIIHYLISYNNEVKSLQYLINEISRNANNIEWKKYYNKLVSILRGLIISPLNKNFITELAEQCLYYLILKSIEEDNNIEFKKIDELRIIIVKAKNNNHTIYKPMLDLMGSCLYKMAKIFDKNNNQKALSIYLNSLQTLGYPLNTNKL